MIDVAAQINSIPLPDAAITVTLAAIFAGSLVSGLAGFGAPAISGALLLHWRSPAEAVPLLLACGITGQLLSIGSLRHSIKWRSCAPFALGGLAGIPFGAELLRNVDGRVFAIGFGGFLICYAVYMLRRPTFALARRGPLIDIAAGFAGGVTGAAIAFPSAIPTALCSLRGLAKHEQRGIVQPFILCTQIAGLAYFSKFDSLVTTPIGTFLWCVPAVLLGTWIGLRLFDRIDDALFRRIVLVFLIVSGASFVL